ncbi:MAG: sensor domain-containing diguanylate cyclase [Tepidanaerobacteraceae bacterium]|jgi:diguanylate cyclase (GGDEF)-like protein|nr:sensor domain-containing diguanylate cyclase [Tepidanaerobacteraceae bacterium]
MLMEKKYAFALSIAFWGMGTLLLSIYFYGFTLHESWEYYFAFLALMIISEFLPIRMDRGFLTMEFGFVYASAIIFGPLPAAVMKFLSTVIVQSIQRRKCEWQEKVPIILFSAGQYMMSFFGGIVTYFAASKIIPESISFREALARGAGILAYFFINNALVEAYIDLERHSRLFSKLGRSLINDAATYFIALPAGIIISETHRYFGFYSAMAVFFPYMAAVCIYRFYMNLLATNRELRALHDVAAAMTSTLDMDEVLETVLASITELAPWDTACLFVYQHDALVPAVYDGIDEIRFKDVRIKPGEGITGSCLLKGKGEIVNNCRNDSRYLRITGIPENTRSLMTVPLISGSEYIGAITLTSSNNYVYTEKNLTLMSILANQAAVAISNARLFDRTARMAITDGLTKLYNYRYIYDELERQANRVKNNGGVFSFIIIDIDHFKSFNDLYGHLTGDEILQNLAQVLRNNVRENDVVGRYGGEEFAVILPGISSMEALGIAERIRQAVEKTEFARTVLGQSLYITVSAGVASYPDDALSVDDLVKKADSALLFGAKQDGRNRVVRFKGAC